MNAKSIEIHKISRIKEFFAIASIPNNVKSALSNKCQYGDIGSVYGLTHGRKIEAMVLNDDHSPTSERMKSFHSFSKCSYLGRLDFSWLHPDLLCATTSKNPDSTSSADMSVS